MSRNNQALFHVEWTSLHDTAIMLGMRAFGICKAAEIKKRFAMFSHIEATAILRRCYKLLGCSSVKTINKLECDPYKV